MWWLTDVKGKSLGAGEQLFPDLIDTSTFSGTLPTDVGGQPLRLTVTLLDPSGSTAAREVLEWPARQQDGY
jgi:hypothetical protein